MIQKVERLKELLVKIEFKVKNKVLMEEKIILPLKISFNDFENVVQSL